VPVLTAEGDIDWKSWSYADLLTHIANDIDLTTNVTTAGGSTSVEFTRPGRMYRANAYTVTNTGANVQLDTYPTSQAVDDPYKRFGIASTGTYTTFAAGWYHADGQLDFLIGSPIIGTAWGIAAIARNGASQFLVKKQLLNQMGSNQDDAIPVSGTFWCNAGDVIGLWGLANTSILLDVCVGCYYNNYLSVYRVA
jgi:hypothetical protein